MTPNQAPAPARTGVILAGGAASRMPGGKAGALLGGEPLLAHAVALTRAAGLEPIIVAREHTALPPTDATVWREPAGGEPHPLAGIAWALAGGAAPIVTLPIDLPLLPPEVLAGLASGPWADAVLAVDGRPAALVARLSAGQAPDLAQAAAAGAPALRTLRTAGAVLVELRTLTAVPAERALLNVNDPATLAAAQRHLTEG